MQRKESILFLIFTIFLSPETEIKQQGKTGLDQKQKGEVEKIIKKYFEAKEEDKAKILTEIAQYDRPSKEDIDHFTKFCLELAKQGPKADGKSPSTLNHPDYKGKYYIKVPEGAKSKSIPLLIGLHGGGKGVGDGMNIPQIYKGAHKKFDWVSAFPEVIVKEDGAWNTEREERFVIELIEELKRTWQIDTNRIYLTGHSMGGFGTWSIGGHYADIFAALNPNSGGGFEHGVMPNLKNAPIYFWHADKDKVVSPDLDRQAEKILKELKKKYGPYEFIYEEVKANHHNPASDMKPILEWMYNKKRDPYPKHVIWEPFRPYKRHFYWLKYDAVDKKLSRIEAKIDGNKISLTGNTRGLTVFLNEKLVDLKKNVQVSVDGVNKFNSTVLYSIVALVESIEIRKDPEMYFVSKVRLD